MSKNNIDREVERITAKMVEQATIKYADDPEKGLRVVGAMEKLFAFVANEFSDPSDAFDAICWVAKVIEEAKEYARRMK
jgi:hypothetical protein